MGGSQALPPAAGAAGAATAPWEGNPHLKNWNNRESEVKLRQNAFPRYTPAYVSSLLTECGKEAEKLHGHSEIGAAPCATPFFRGCDSPGPAGHQLIQYWKFCSLLKAVRNSEQLKDEPHFQLLLSQVFFALICKSLRKTGLCFTLWAVDLKCASFIILYLKMQTVLHSFTVIFRISGLELRGSTATMKGLLVL